MWRGMVVLGAGLTLSGAVSAQTRSTITSWSFGFDLSAMAQSPATQAAIGAQCRLLTERKAASLDATSSSSEALREEHENCVRTFGKGASSR